MKALFEVDKEFAFIYQQLKWIGLEDTLCESDLLEEVILEDDLNTLENYLDSIVGKRLYDEEQQELSDLIIKELITIDTKTDYRTKKLKPSTLESIIRQQLELPYAVSKSKREDKIIDGKRVTRRYIIISKIKE